MFGKVDKNVTSVSFEFKNYNFFTAYHNFRLLLDPGIEAEIEVRCIITQIQEPKHPN